MVDCLYSAPKTCQLLTCRWFWPLSPLEKFLRAPMTHSCLFVHLTVVDPQVQLALTSGTCCPATWRCCHQAANITFWSAILWLFCVTSVSSWASSRIRILSTALWRCTPPASLATPHSPACGVLEMILLNVFVSMKHEMNLFAKKTATACTVFHHAVTG